MIFKKHEWAAIIFSVIYILYFGFGFISKLNYEFLVYVVVLFVIGFFVLWGVRKGKLDGFALWGLSIWGFLHMAGGGWRWYGIILWDLFRGPGEFILLKMDQFIHFYGFAVTAVVIYQLLVPYFKNPKKLRAAIFFAWIGSMGLGALNEVVEFLVFISIEKTGVGDLYNLGLDLIFNMFGALFGAFVGHYWHKRKLRN